MNPFEYLSLWRALRKFSLTFSLIFATTLLGFSVVKLLRQLLGELSVPWLALWILPIIVVSTLARKETEWIPDFTLRKRIAWGIVIGSLIIFFSIGRVFAPEPEPRVEDPDSESSERVRRGPPKMRGRGN